MIIKLNRKQFDYLNQHLFSKQEGINIKFNIYVKNGLFLIELDEDAISCIREWAIEKQIFLGFDANYELTDEGKILEDLIDLFYMG